MSIRFPSYVLLWVLCAAWLGLPGRVDAQPTSYKLGAGDVLSIIVDNHPQFSVNQVTVTPAGMISVPVVNTLRVTGKTLEQIDNEVTRGLRQRLRNPRVTVTLVKARPQQVFVLGPVTRPGAYEIQPGWRISEALAATGGLTVRPALTEAVLSRPNGKVTPVNLEQILNNSNSVANLQLQPGDRLLVTERTLRVSVTGQVKRSGVFNVPIGSSAVDALSFAEGPLPEAALSKATIRRTNGLIEQVNLFKAVTLGDETADVELREGDVLSIPQSDDRVAVQGSVTRPGFVPIEDGRTLTVAQAVAQAGNYTQKAALSKAAVQRVSGEIIPVNLYEVLINRNVADNILLEPGDVLTIPESNDTVTVLGAVNKPGILELPDGQSLSVAQAIAQAGNYNERAALTRATVRSEDGSIEAINLYNIIVRGQQQDDLLLQSGDVVVVPEASGITVIGSVTRPGSYYLQEGSQPRLSTALANAGDLEGNLNPEDVRISITRTLPNGNQRLLSVDPVSFFNRSDPSQNALLEDGDLVTISPIAKRTVLIAGEVERPGAYELQEGESVPQLIARAGGAKPTAALQQVRVSQNDKTETVDVLNAVRNGETLEYSLQPGASVVVPENKSRVLVLQAVNKPGAYPIPENEVFTLGDAISAAGGTQARASYAIIARQLPNGQIEQRSVSFDPKKNKDGLSTNIRLQSNDVVYVPDAKSKTPFTSILLSVASAFNYLF